MQPVAGGVHPNWPHSRSAGGVAPSAVKVTSLSTISLRSPSGPGSVTRVVAARSFVQPERLSDAGEEKVICTHTVFGTESVTTALRSRSHAGAPLGTVVSRINVRRSSVRRAPVTADGCAVVHGNPDAAFDGDAAPARPTTSVPHAPRTSTATAHNTAATAALCVLPDVTSAQSPCTAPTSTGPI